MPTILSATGLSGKSRSVSESDLPAVTQPRILRGKTVPTAKAGALADARSSFCLSETREPRFFLATKIPGTNHGKPMTTYQAEVVENIENRPGTWNSIRVGVFRCEPEKKQQIGQYTRNYPSLLRTFCPFT